MASWINPKVNVKGAEKKGIGSFAIAPIAKSEVVVVQGGRIINYARIEASDYAPFKDHCFQIDKDLLICPVEPRRESLDGVFQINHSCDPNCGFQGQIIVVAMHDIEAGEEITYDYAMTDANWRTVTCTEMPCLCGASTCRRVITGEDWRREEVQKKYRGFFSHHIQKMINATNGNRRYVR